LAVSIAILLRNVYCFAKPEDAEKFMQRFGGEKFDPARRGKGRNWSEWKK
jgi:hypothetical protein